MSNKTSDNQLPMYLAEEMSEGERGKEAVHFLDFPAPAAAAAEH